MDILVFRKVFNNLVLNSNIFNYVHHIFISILKKEKTFRWDEVIESRYALAGNGYLNELKEYYRKKLHLKFNKKKTVLLNAIASKSLDIIKYIIEELQYDYNSYGCFDRTQFLYFENQDLLTIVSKYGNIEIIKYIDSLKNNNNINNWNYIESFKASPLSKDINVVQFLYNKLIDNNQIPDDNHINSAILNSLSKGRIDIVQRLITLLKNSIILSDNIYIQSAVKSGNLDILFYCLKDNPNKSFLESNDMESNDIIELASRYGYLDIIKWFHQNSNIHFTDSAMDSAASSGHFETVKWLHENRTEGCTTDAMDYAAERGNLEMIKWLHYNRTEGCTTHAMDIAADSGDLEMIKWLHHNRTEGCTSSAMDYAAEYNHFETIEWLQQNRTEGCTTDAMDLAAKNGHFEIIKWLHHNRTEGCTNWALDLAEENDHFEIITWLHKNRTEFMDI